jgi:hypothetical protein
MFLYSFRGIGRGLVPVVFGFNHVTHLKVLAPIRCPVRNKVFNVEVNGGVDGFLQRSWGRRTKVGLDIGQEIHGRCGAGVRCRPKYCYNKILVSCESKSTSGPTRNAKPSQGRAPDSCVRHATHSTRSTPRIWYLGMLFKNITVQVH